MTEKVCKTCKFSDLSYMQSPCNACVVRDDFPAWQPKDPEKSTYTVYPGTIPGTPGFVGFVRQDDYARLQAENKELKEIITAQNLQIAKSSAENARLRDNLIQCRGENAELYDYGADMRIAIRKARKVLRFRKVCELDGEEIRMVSNDQVAEARQILKDALKEGK